MTLPKEYKDLSLAPVAAAIDFNLQRLRDRTPEEIYYEVSLELFGTNLDANNRRFALAETLAHLERLVLEGRAARAGDGQITAYTDP